MTTRRTHVIVRLLLTVTGALCLVAAGESPSAPRGPAQKVVLALHDTGPDAEGSNTLDRELRKQLYDGLGGALDYYSEYLDSGRFHGPHYQTLIGQFLGEKYKGRRVDLLITIDTTGLEFLAERRDDLFPGTPVVFSNTVRPTSIILPNSTGVIAETDFGNSLELALTLQPDLTHVFVVSGAGPSDHAVEQQAVEQFRRFEPQLAFTFLSGLPTAELERRLRALPERSIIYYLLVYQDGTGETFYPLEYLERLANVANRPIYAWIDSEIDHGVIGGRVLRLQSHAAAIAERALRVLRGEPAESIPTSVAAVQNVVDWRQLRRWGISERRLPPDSIVLFRPPGLWRDYRGEVLTGLAGLMLQSLLIIGLLYQRRARRKAEVDSRNSLSLAADANRRVTMSALTGSIAHELSQPLHSILHNAQAGEMLVDSSRATPEIVRTILSEIRTADVRATQIIERHRTLLRTRQLDKKPIDIHAVVRDSLALVAHDTSAREAQVTVDVPSDPCVISGDPVLLQQVFVNLLMNATEAMADIPRERRCVSVLSKPTDGTVEVSVQDTGTGLPENLDRGLFEPFVTTKTNGMGIGLTIARSIVEAHNGRLTAHNNPDGGATFTLTLPRAETGRTTSSAGSLS